MAAVDAFSFALNDDTVRLVHFNMEKLFFEIYSKIMVFVGINHLNWIYAVVKS